MTIKRDLKLGFILHGVGPGWADWRHPDTVLDASTNFEFYRQQAQVAERGKFHFLFVADSVSINKRSSPHYLNRFEPLTILSALAGATTKIGLVGTATVSYTEPYNLARQFSSLDHISRGRAGWNVVTSWLEDTATNYSKDSHYDHDVRYRLASEHLDVVQGLWDSWEDDALVRNKTTGQFFDPDKLHELNHKGEFFKVRGPLNISRSPQGQPVIFQAGASEDGKNFAAKRADAIFVHHDALEEATAYYHDLKERAKSYGRDPEKIFILPGAKPVIGSTEAEAEHLYNQMASLITTENALPFLGRAFSDYDFSDHDLDEPFPDIAHIGLKSNQSASSKIVKTAREENLTLRETALRFATPRGQFVGTTGQVADRFEKWFLERGADGFNLFESLPGQLEVFVDQVVPLLQKKGIFHKDYEGKTFRENLGLDYPINRYTLPSARATA